MSRPDFTQAREYALVRLTHELSPALCYHSVAHTSSDVAPAVERLARVLALDKTTRMLLLTAAYYHDIGYVQRTEGHEMASAAIASAILPGFGYSPAQISSICGMIMATRLPQTPHTPLEQILADADLDSLGRDDFLQKSVALREELATRGEHVSDLEWYQRQIAFLHDHSYFTAAARSLRDAGKQRNLAQLQQLLTIEERLA